MRRAERVSSADVAALLGIPGPGSFVVLAIYLATIFSLAFSAGGAPMRAWSGWVALALVVIASAVVISPGFYPLPVAKTLVVIGATTASSILLPLELDARIGAGYTTWHILANTLVLLALAVRGHIGGAWVGFALMGVVTAAWTMLDGAGPAPGLLMVAHESVALLAGTLFAVGLGRLIRPLTELHRLETERAADAAAARASIDERAVQMQRFDGSVRDAVMSIASGAPLTEASRASYRALEGALRDRIRGRNLCVEPLTASVQAARLRGVDVLLLDDSGVHNFDVDVGGAFREPLARRVAALVDEAREGSVTVRLAGADGELVASVVMTSARGAVRHERFDLAS
jgi:hypothetical protein